MKQRHSFHTPVKASGRIKWCLVVTRKIHGMVLRQPELPTALVIKCRERHVLNYIANMAFSPCNEIHRKPTGFFFFFLRELHWQKPTKLEEKRLRLLKKENKILCH